MMRKDVNLLVFILGCDDEAQAGLQGAGKAKAQGRQAPGARCIEVRGCAAVRRDAANGRSMGAALGRRRTRFAQAWRAGATTAVGRRTGARTCQASDGRSFELRISHRALDLASHWQADRTTLWRAIQHRALVAFAAPARLFLPEAREARHPAQRGRDCALEAAHLACAQKKAQREGRTIVFIDESGLSERPSVARTWSLRGCTPVLQHSFDWKQLSAIAGLSFWQFYFRFFPGAIRSEQIIAFLTALTRQIKRPLLIIWDGAAIHRSRKVKTWLQDQDGSLAVARLPAYAPELNPVEAIWAYLKKHEIANLCCDTIGEVGQFARNRLKSMQRRSHLIIGFWKQAELAF